MNQLLLFDIDSVLVEPNGYWAAIQETMGLYARGLGYGADGVPTLEDIEEFEANGLSSEWDSCALCVGALLIRAYAGHTGLASDRLRDWLFHPVDPFPGPPGPRETVPPGFFSALVRRTRRDLQPGERMAQASLRTLLASAPGTLEAVLHTLLDDTHDLARAPVSQIFQHFALGDAGYEACYGRPPAFASLSLLAERDRPLLTSAGRAELRGLLADHRFGASLYTARPSRPPRDAHAGMRGFSPEAEIAAELAGVADLPLIAFGSMQWLAARRQQRPDAYVKPSPVQALAAIAGALGAGETAALEAAVQVVEPPAGAAAGDLPAPFEALRAQETRVTVFEDTERGARGVLAAVELLRAAGCKTVGETVGIAAAGSAKHDAFAGVAAVIVPDVNAGITWIAQRASESAHAV